MVPFAPDVWPTPELRAAADELWAWNRAVRTGSVSDDALAKAQQICAEHELPLALLDAQWQCAKESDLVSGFPSTQELLTYIDEVMGSHAMLLAKLAGERSNWVERPVRSFARATFMTRRLCNLNEDLQSRQLWVPLDMMKQADVDRRELERGVWTPAIRRLLWKQVVLTRDAYAGCRTLTTDFSGWLRRRVRIYWTRGLYQLALIETRRFDVWSKPVKLSGFRLAQLYWQVYVGKSFR